MSGYSLLTYAAPGGPEAGLLLGERVIPLSSVEGVDGRSVLELLERWESVRPALECAAASTPPTQGRPLGELQLLSPVLYPTAIYCAAANYRDHMRAMAMRLGQPDEPDPHELDIKPYHFVVPGRTCICGPADPIRLPGHGRQIDWEVELVAVIGSRAKNVSIDEALQHVAAYTIGNDISVRDRQFIKIPNVATESVFRNDFIGMKGFDQSCAVGPWLTPSGQIDNPQHLRLQTWIDDEPMQDSSTSNMVFTIAEQIAYLSSRVTLLPGDLVMTGTPAGTGMERDRFLRAGETVRMRVEGVGELRQQVVA